ncbi:hypothetical protein OJAV_G00164950 [Oryzias javanicus]|uniref:SCP domain-containing protein n=1 Tax=Oryzias javanicus TaxID=123683 RepID=A0A3S2MA74_ORYJA|nr:hypothetical protein OJAV_G00164950 [Oryzias javanicus]
MSGRRYTLKLRAAGRVRVVTSRESRSVLCLLFGTMFVALVCILTLHGAHSACVPVNVCPENASVQGVIVDVHNAFRRAVEPAAADMLMMSYSEELAVTAQAWVDKCVLDHGPPSSRMLNGYELGENLFYSTSPNSWTSVIKAWYQEVSHFTFPNASTNGKPIGHYTQVVWNSSYKVGCGVTLCPNNIYLYGCHYYRAGNFKRWPPYKVGTPCASCPTTARTNSAQTPVLI